MTVGPELERTLAEAQRLGFLGDRELGEVIEHARGFATALDDLRASTAGAVPRVVDLGAGGGVPGLVVADRRPDLRVTLVDRRAKRTDFLQRVVTRLGWQEHVTVICADVDELIRRQPHHYHAAVARGFGPPERTLRVARQLIVTDGRIVISEPPQGDRWDAELIEELGLRRREADFGAGRLAIFDRFT